MDSLRILHIATHSGVYRGGAVQACRMAEGMRRHGHEVTIMAAEDRAASPEQRRADAATWRYLEDLGVKVATMDYSGPRGVLRLRRLLDQKRFDVVHAHRDEALVAAWLATWGRDRPVLVAQRGTVSHPPSIPKRAFRSPKVRAVICVARAVQRKMIKLEGMDGKKVHVVYGSVDLEKFAPRPPHASLLRTLRLPEGAYVVGSLSAFRGPKGFRHLIPALRKAMKDSPAMVAVFLGKGVEENVGPLAEKLGILDRCRFMGHQDNVADWLSVMDVTVVAATRREGLSGVLRESLAAGVPVISTDCAGNAEIVRDRETGLLVPKADTRALAGALSWACAHPAEMREMAAQGRAWVAGHCSIETQSSAIESIYRECLARA